MVAMSIETVLFLNGYLQYYVANKKFPKVQNTMISFQSTSRPNNILSLMFNPSDSKENLMCHADDSVLKKSSSD